MLLAVIQASANKMLTTFTMSTRRNASQIFFSCMLELCNKVTADTPQNDPYREALNAAFGYFTHF